MKLFLKGLGLFVFVACATAIIFSAHGLTWGTTTAGMAVLMGFFTFLALLPVVVL